MTDHTQALIDAPNAQPFNHRPRPLCMAVQWWTMGDHALVEEGQRRWAHESDDPRCVIERDYAQTMGKLGQVVLGEFEGVQVDPGDWMVYEDDHGDGWGWNLYSDEAFRGLFVPGSVASVIAVAPEPVVIPTVTEEEGSAAEPVATAETVTEEEGSAAEPVATAETVTESTESEPTATPSDATTVNDPAPVDAPPSPTA
jgi:hypothetical protein